MEVSVLAHKPSENTMGMRQSFTIPLRVLADGLSVIFSNKALGANRNLPAVIPAQAGIQRFNVAAILKHSCNIKDWVPACAGMTALCVLFELLSDRPSEKSRSDTRIRQLRLAEMSDLRIRPTLLIMS